MASKEKRVIYCPGCNRKAFEIRVNCGSVIQKKCDKCKKIVDYNPRYGVRILPIPKRECSSGRRFY